MARNLGKRSWKWLLLGGLGLVVSWMLAAQILDAWNRRPTDERLSLGRTIFEHRWQQNDPLAAEGDGLGPVFNAQSCVECHFQGGIGGGGSNKHNVLSFEAFPSRQRPKLVSGVVHLAATDSNFRETTQNVNQTFPIIKGGSREIDGCTINVPDFDPVQFAKVNTPALFGAGLIDKIPDRAITFNGMGRSIKSLSRSLEGDFDSMPVGKVRVLNGGNVGRFGWKGQFATLEDFVATACAVELGLTNPMRSQDLPRQYKPDPDAKMDINKKQLCALVCFVANLPRPIQVMPADPTKRNQAERGEALFASVGCAECHTPNLGGVEGVYSDFRLYTVVNPNTTRSYAINPDQAEVPDSHPKPGQWKTPPLWGVADSAPYFHDGQSPDLESAIQRHSGQAKKSREKYQRLKQGEREALIAFLKTLRAPAHHLTGKLKIIRRTTRGRIAFH